LIIVLVVAEVLIKQEFISAYNLLVHLVNQSPDVENFLPRICNNLSTPITSSTSNGPGLALSVLATVFNILPPDNETRYHVFLAILKVVRTSTSFDALKPQLVNLDRWIVEWETDEEDQQKLYTSISEVAQEAGERDQAYLYLLKALRTVPANEVGGSDAHALSVRALKSALSDPEHFDFQDLTALDCVQALRKSEPVLFELLEIFSAEQLDEYNDFGEEHDGFVEQQGLDAAVLHRKMRLLTLASIAASTQSRSLPYQQISKALKVPAEEVEMWVIDVIRAGLVEGKLSQLNQTFLIHRSTYRVFGEKQWTEVSGRLDTWRSSLEGVLTVVRQEREKMIREKERELRELDGRLGGMGSGGPGYSKRAVREIEANAD
jgi:translation initiation factor 3 subunit M